MAKGVLGAILAGGRSSRFGSDKALALLDGKPLLAHVVEALRAQVDQILICGRTFEGLASITDRPAAGMGPLGGLNAALHHAAASGFDLVLSIGCDMPLIPPDLRKRLEQAPGAVVVEGQPLVGLWPASLAPLLDSHLATSDDRSMRRWVEISGASNIRLEAPLPNINSSEQLADLAAARQRPGTK